MGDFPISQAGKLRVLRWLVLAGEDGVISDQPLKALVVHGKYEMCLTGCGGGGCIGGRWGSQRRLPHDVALPSSQGLIRAQDVAYLAQR